VQPTLPASNVDPIAKDKAINRDIAPAQLIVVGSAAIDITSKAGLDAGDTLTLRSTVPGGVSSTLGGVARNVAEAAHRLSSTTSTLLVSPVGSDSFARSLISETDALGMRTDGFIEVASNRTSVCNMFLDAKGSLLGGVADMEITHGLRSPQVNPHTHCNRLGADVGLPGCGIHQRQSSKSGSPRRKSIRRYFSRTGFRVQSDENIYILVSYPHADAQVVDPFLVNLRLWSSQLASSKQLLHH